MEINVPTMQIEDNHEQLVHLATRFRAAIINSQLVRKPFITFDYFPLGACGNTARLLAEYLREHGYGDFDYVTGERGGRTHAWLDKAGLIIDITADQFDDQDAAVIVTRDHGWHSLFEGQIRWHGDYRLFPNGGFEDMPQMYALIQQALE